MKWYVVWSSTPEVAVEIVYVLGVFVWILPRLSRSISDWLTRDPLFLHLLLFCISVDFFAYVQFLFACVFRRWLKNVVKSRMQCLFK